MYPVATCKKPEHYCKAWDGKGSPKKNLLPGEICQNSKKPDACEFLVVPKKRDGCDWLHRTISGSPTEVAEIIQEGHKVLTKKKAKEIQHRICADCGEDATHKIEGYKPTYLCFAHAENAIADSFTVVELVEEELFPNA